MVRKNLFIKIMIIFVAASMFFSFLPSMATAQKLEGKSVKVGVLLTLMGRFAAQGRLQKTALDIAKDEINSTGGIWSVPLELIIYDTRGEGQEAISMMKKLAQTDKVLAVLGPFSSTECELAFPIANKEEMVAVSASSAKPGVAAKNRPWAFRVSETMDKLILPMVAKWKKTHSVERVVLLYDAEEALFKAEGTIIFPMALKRNDIKIVDSLTFLTQDVDFSAQVTKVKSLDPQGIIIAASYNAAANLVREIRKQGLKQPIATSPGAMAPDFIRLASKNAEGVFTGASAWEGNPDPKAQAFLKEMQKRAGVSQLDNTAWFMYDAISITKTIIEQMGITNKPEDLAKDRAKIKDGWAKVKDYQGVSGKTTINEDGDAEREVFVLVIKNGRYELVQ